MMRFCTLLLGCVCLTACMPTTPQRKPSPHPVFDHPKYDVSMCDTVDVATVSDKDAQLMKNASRLVNMAVMYNSTPSYVLKMLYVAERYGVSENMFLTGFENFVDVLEKKQLRDDPVVSTYYADSFLAFNQWHSTLTEMTEQGRTNERNQQIKDATGISPSMSLEWYKYLLSDWQNDFDSVSDSIPTDEQIVKMATANYCIQVENTKKDWLMR